MLKKLKLAAEFFGGELIHMEGFSPHIKTKGEKQYHITSFNPHEKEGLHWLNELEKKLSPAQHDSYTRLIMKKWCGERTLDMKDKNISCLLQWLTYKQEFRFNCIMEVIG